MCSKVGCWCLALFRDSISFSGGKEAARGKHVYFPSVSFVEVARACMATLASARVYLAVFLIQ